MRRSRPASILCATLLLALLPAPASAELSTAPAPPAAARSEVAVQSAAAGWVSAFDVQPRETEFTALLRRDGQAAPVLVSPVGQRFGAENAYAIGRWFADGDYIEVTVDAAVPGSWRVEGGQIARVGRLGFTIDKPPRAVPAGQATALVARIVGNELPLSLTARTVVRAAISVDREPRPLAVSLSGQDFHIEAPATLPVGRHKLSLSAVGATFTRSFELVLNVVEPGRIRATFDGPVLVGLVEPTPDLEVDGFAATVSWRDIAGNLHPLPVTATRTGHAFRLSRSLVGSDPVDITVAVSGNAGNVAFTYDMLPLHVVFGSQPRRLPPPVPQAAAPDAVASPDVVPEPPLAALIAIGLAALVLMAWLTWVGLSLRQASQPSPSALRQAMAALAATLEKGNLSESAPQPAMAAGAGV